MFFLVMVLVTLGFLRHLLLVKGFEIKAGTTKVSDSTWIFDCGDIQEFSCVNDVCDQCAGPNHRGRCRNGADCAPGQLCDKTPGHCLEDKFCTDGRHKMPTSDVGTPKHFRCLDVQFLDAGKVIVIYENADFTGDSCFLNGTGAWASPNDVLANAVDTNIYGGSFKQCRRAGEKSGGTTAVDISAGKVSDFCPAVGAAQAPSNKGPAGLKEAFPYFNRTFWYANDPGADKQDADGVSEEDVPDGTDGKRLLRRRGRSRLESRGKKRKWAETSNTIREKAALNGVFQMAQQQYEATGDVADLENVPYVPPPGTMMEESWFYGFAADGWQADHVAELQLIRGFFDANPGWAFILPQLENPQGCYEQRVTDIMNAQTNLIGIGSRINSLKGKCFGASVSVIPDSWFRAELAALKRYLTYINSNNVFLEAINAMGDVLDEIWRAAGSPGPSSGGNLPSTVWRRWAQGLLDGARAQIDSLLNGATNFRPNDQWNTFYKSAEGPPR